MKFHKLKFHKRLCKGDNKVLFTIVISYQDSYPNCKPSNIKSRGMRSVSGEGNENQTNGQGMKFVSVMVKNWLAYDVLTFILFMGLPLCTCNV